MPDAIALVARRLNIIKASSITLKRALDEAFKFSKIFDAGEVERLLIPQCINRIQLGGLVGRIKSKEDADGH